MKTIHDCIRFTNENPVCYFATTEGNQPRVRALGFWYADDTGFYFQTASMKEIPTQLKQNPNVEVCFYTSQDGLGTMLRIAGKTEFIQDRESKAKALEERPFLKKFGMTPESEELVLFRIPHGEAYFWTMEDNLKPKVKILF